MVIVADQFTWGVWMTTETPVKRASGVMREDVFRRLLKDLAEVCGSTDRALDRIKDIMICELNKAASKNGA